jgi:hypothetical protein
LTINEKIKAINQKYLRESAEDQMVYGFFLMQYYMGITSEEILGMPYTRYELLLDLFVKEKKAEQKARTVGGKHGNLKS